MIPEPGIYHNIPFEEYIRWEAASNTILGIIENQSPAHAQAFMATPPKSSEALDFGQALHTFNLEVMSFDEKYIVAPNFDRRTKKGKAASAKFDEDNKGKKRLEQDAYDTILAMAASIETHHFAKRFMWGGKPELSIVWRDKATGVLCKARLDYYHQDGVIADLKSTRDASVAAFSKAIYNYGYHRQAAFYSAGWEALEDEEPEFIFIAVEKTRPYGVATYIACEDVIIAGRFSYKQALKTYAECYKSGLWPSYPQEISEIHLPAWAYDPRMAE